MRTIAKRLATRALPTLLLTASLTAGCSAEYSPIGPCFDEPQAIPVMPAYPTADRSSLPPFPNIDDYDRSDPSSMARYAEELKRYEAADTEFSARLQADFDAYHALRDPENVVLPVENGIAAGDPGGVPFEIGSRVTSALVEIRVGDAKATGFVTLNEQGDQVVVTAAHVADGVRPSNITLTTDTGHVTPTGGCVIHEEDGERVAASETRVVDYDVAVLMLPENVTQEPLQLATQAPTPGKYVFPVDYRGFTSVDSGPAQSTVIVTPRAFDTTYYTLVNGATAMGTNRSQWTFDQNHVGPGASGGPVVNNLGEVVAVTTGSRGVGDLAQVVPANILAADYNIEFPGAPTSDGWQPTVSFANGTDVVRNALGSPVVNP